MARRRVCQHNDKRQREAVSVAVIGAGASYRDRTSGTSVSTRHGAPAGGHSPCQPRHAQGKIARAQARSSALFQRCIPVALLALPGAACGSAACASACVAAAAAPCPSNELEKSLHVRRFKDKEGGHGASHYSGVRICVCMYHPRQPIHECWALQCILSYGHVGNVFWRCAHTWCILGKVAGADRSWESPYLHSSVRAEQVLKRKHGAKTRGRDSGQDSNSDASADSSSSLMAGVECVASCKSPRKLLLPPRVSDAADRQGKTSARDILGCFAA